KVLEVPTMITKETWPLQPNPEISLAICHQAKNRIERVAAFWGLREQLKIPSIEPNEPFLRSNPQITIGSLSHRVNRPAGKPPFASPFFMKVLRKKLRPSICGARNQDAKHCDSSEKFWRETKTGKPATECIQTSQPLPPWAV